VSNIEIYPKSKVFENILELYPPQLANKFLPDWYKKNKIITNKLDLYKDNHNLHAKNCPAITEEITNGIIIPAWSDIYININNGSVYWEVSLGKSISFDWISNHNDKQIKLMELNELQSTGILKFNSPYLIKTNKGYGTEFKDMFYHHRKNIRLLPGMVETDIWHEINFPFEFLYNTKDIKTEFIIEAGDPLIMLKPYQKKIKYSLKVNKYNQDIIDKQFKNDISLYSKSHSWKDFKKDML
jgi:hypothetical protein